MPWNDSTKVLTAPFTKIAANGQGDLQKALSSSLMSQIRLFTETNINPMAKYKPIKSNKPSITAADREAARYGMSEPSYFYPNSYAIPDAWTYNRPTAENPNEWLRALDFDGYDAQAVPPLAMEVPGGLRVAEPFGILMWKDSYVNNYLSSRMTNRWWADRSLSIAELLGSGLNDYNNYWVSFVFYLYNTAGTSIQDACLVATNKKFGNMLGADVFMFCPQGDGTQDGDYIESGVHYPVIPMLQSTAHVGRKFAIVSCLSSTGPSDPTSYAYQVLPNNYSCIPLGFDARHRWDYAIETAESAKAIDMLTGVFNTGPTLTFIRQHDGGWNEYSCSAWVSADITSADGWQGTSAMVHVSATAPGGMFGAVPGSGGEYGEYVEDVGILVPSGGHTNTRQLVQLPNVFIYKDAPHTVIVTAKFTQNGNEKAFNNTLTISD